MSSVPPYTPPIPPYDPKTQGRIYREQQKAARRTQRNAWKAGYVSTYGPRVPSVVGPILLIGIGVVALLIASGRIAASQFWTWYGHWWSLVLIGAGLALLGEWALDLRRKIPVRRGGSFVGILILLGIIGLIAAGRNNFVFPHGQWDNHGDDFFNVFGPPEHDFDRPALSAQIPANAAIEIQNPRGDVSITASDTSTIEVQAHEVAFASSDADAQKIFDAEAPRLTVSGSAVLVKFDGNANGRVNLTVTVPKTARVTINSAKGDVTATGLGAGLQLNARGDVHLSDLTGSVEVRFSDGRHDFFARQLQGDLTLNGDGDNLTLSGIKGKVAQNGEIFGDVHMENVSGPIHLHTSVTDLELAELPGDLTLNSDELRVTEAKGRVRIVTHSKDINLSQISGDSYVEDRNGRISVEPAGSYAVEAKNSKGDVEVSLPPNASATVEGRTHNGEIMTEFGLPVSGEENKTVSGKIGSGRAKIVLSTENGDVRIKRGSGIRTAPSAPMAPEAPKLPAPPNAPHLKAPRMPPGPPVSQ